jgi:hypothetical protein
MSLHSLWLGYIYREQWVDVSGHGNIQNTLTAHPSCKNGISSSNTENKHACMQYNITHTHTHTSMCCNISLTVCMTTFPRFKLKTTRDGLQPSTYTCTMHTTENSVQRITLKISSQLALLGCNLHFYKSFETHLTHKEKFLTLPSNWYEG